MTKKEANKLKKDIKRISDNPIFNMVSRDTILEIVLEKIDMLEGSEDNGVTNNEYIKQLIEDENTISLLFEHIKYEMCDKYCKYPLEWDAEKEGMELEKSKICANCPLTVL